MTRNANCSKDERVDDSVADVQSEMYVHIPHILHQLHEFPVYSEHEVISEVWFSWLRPLQCADPDYYYDKFECQNPEHRSKADSPMAVERRNKCISWPCFCVMVSQGSHEDDFYHKLVERICGNRMQKDPSNILQTKLLFESLCCKSAEFSSLKLILIKDSACLSISRGCLFVAKTSEVWPNFLPSDYGS